jgi:hypothetical protein
MSMMLPPGEAPPALPLPPGGGGMGGPMDSLNQGPIPAEGGMGGLLAALGGGGGDLPPEMAAGDALGPGSEDTGAMDAIGHIQQAMKHLMMAIAKDDDDERGLGITKGMGALQGLLAGEQKKNAQLSQLGG